ncbi:MAG TPA: amino acid adenylation domain-containing protein, partial [Ktedonobacteraceae bacterium]|nr:amino acid adenylation domain-containing protein [Ktedonobacteraceae bacterium]
ASWQAESIARTLVQQEVEQPFVLARGPLLRGWLLTLSSQEHVLLLSLHHIITDGWSMSILLRELSQGYEACSRGQHPAWGVLPIQYADYAAWQRSWLQGEVLQQQLDYWKQQLAGLTPLTLPTDHLYPPVQTHRGATQSLLLPQALSQQLQVLAQQEGVTLFMLLLAAFQALLSRYSGQEDIAVGTPIANRTWQETEDLIGFFVNTLVMRSDLSGELSFTQLLERVRAMALEAYMHQDVPFEQVVEALQPERDRSRSPLFQVLFVLQNTPQISIEQTHLRIEEFAFEQGSAHFELRMGLTQNARGLETVLDYNTDLFEATTIQRLLLHWQTLLEGIVARPDRLLWQLPLLSQAEQDQVLRSWNATRVDYPADLCVHQLVELQVQRSLDTIALVAGEHHLSYEHLNRRANQVAHTLQVRGVGPESVVGICMERSLEMVIGLLAILKAGGAYLPLDPSYPDDRLISIMHDAHIHLLLTRSHLLPRFCGERVEALCLDSEWESKFAREKTHNVATTIQMEHLAYVIYTSGSTGKPKGAMNTHSGICNRLLWMQQEYCLTENDTVLQKTPFSFDVSVWEFFWPLLTGARLVMANPEGHRDSRYLVAIIEEQAVTTIHFVPSMLRLFLEEPALQRCISLRQLICSGEALTQEHQKQVFARLAVQLHNLYGPTEAAVDVTFWHCQPEDQFTTPPIGHPIANTQIHILDAHMNLVPVGVAGLLYIGGVGVARGY